MKDIIQKWNDGQMYTLKKEAQTFLNLNLWTKDKISILKANNTLRLAKFTFHLNWFDNSIKMDPFN